MTPTPPVTSIDYRCSVCGADGIKLWRLPHKVDGLKCIDCVVTTRDVVLTSLDDKGLAETSDGYGPTDQIGGMLPAVPVDDTMWGYTLVPQDQVEWWQSLPNRLVKVPE